MGSGMISLWTRTLLSLIRHPETIVMQLVGDIRRDVRLFEERYGAFVRDWRFVGTYTKGAGWSEYGGISMALNADILR